VANYQPLGPGSYSTVGGRSQDLGEFSPPYGGPIFSAYRVAYVHRAVFTYAFSVRNNGPFGVSVTGIDGWDPDFVGLLQFIDARLSRSDRVHSIIARDLQSFHPFSLAPGHERDIVIRARFVHCGSWAEQSAETYTAQKMRFRFVGINRTAWVTLPFNLEVKAPPDSECPEPRPAH
jgi:hypothetical protein